MHPMRKCATAAIAAACLASGAPGQVTLPDWGVAIPYGAVNQGVRHCVTLDVDQDGDMDVAVLTAGSAVTNHIHVYRNDGRGNLAGPVATPIGTPQYPHALGSFLTVANLDGDPYADLVVPIGVGTSGAVGVQLFRNSGAGGSFVPCGFLALPRAYQVVSARINGDGIDDLVIATDGGPTQHVALSTGPCSYMVRSFDLEGAGSNYFVAAADLDSPPDGRVDLVFTALHAGLAFVLKGLGNGEFQVVHRFSPPQQCGHLRTADLLGPAGARPDGLPDIVMGTVIGHPRIRDNALYIYENLGGMRFRLHPEPRIWPWDNRVADIGLGHATQDPYPEVAIINGPDQYEPRGSDDQKLGIFTNLNYYAWPVRVLHTGLSGQQGLAAGDLNGDGCSDFVVVNERPEAARGSIAVFLSQAPPPALVAWTSGRGDLFLEVRNIPAGTAEAWLLPSTNVSGPVGQGPLIGLYPSDPIWQAYFSPRVPGNILHHPIPNDPFEFPNVPIYLYLGLPAGLTLDVLAWFEGPGPGSGHPRGLGSGVVRLTF